MVGGRSTNGDRRRAGNRDSHRAVTLATAASIPACCAAVNRRANDPAALEAHRHPRQLLAASFAGFQV